MAGIGDLALADNPKGRGKVVALHFQGWALSALCRAGFEADARIEKGFQFLLSLRQDDGGWAWRGVRTDSAARPSSHLITGMVLRAFASSKDRRGSREARRAAELLATRFLQPDRYEDRKAPAYWEILTEPRFYTDVLDALDTITSIGLWRSFLQAPPDDALNRRGDVAGEGRRFFLENRVHGFHGRIAPEGAHSSHHLVEDGAKAEDVRAGIREFAAHLLWRHVTGGAQDRSGIGDSSDGRAFAAPFGARLLGQAEVENLRPPVASEKDVVGLDIAMHDSFLVRRRQSCRDLHPQIHRLAYRQSACLEPLGQAFAFEQLGDQKMGAVLRADIMNCEEIGMVQSSQNLRLLLEAAQPLFLSAEFGWQNLDGNRAAQSRVASAVNLAHAALAN